MLTFQTFMDWQQMLRMDIVSEIYEDGHLKKHHNSIYVASFCNLLWSLFDADIGRYNS